MFRQCVLVLAMLMVTPGTRAQEPATDWRNLGRLRAGDRIKVTTRDTKKHSGSFVAYSEEALNWRQGRGRGEREVGYLRQQVQQVLLLGPRNRRRAALFGFVIVFAPLATLSLEVETCTQTATGVVCRKDASDQLALVGLSAVAGGVGAGIGALVARRPKTLIYQAEASGVPEPNPPPLARFPVGSHAAALPAPLRDVCRRVSTERAAEEAARALAAEDEPRPRG